MQNTTLIYKAKPSGKALRTINKQTTDEKIISLWKALGLDLRREQREYKLRMGLRQMELAKLKNF